MTYDLRTEPAFPVTRHDGSTTRLGLRDLLTDAHMLRHLDVAIPPAESGMLRILYTITARVTGLDSYHDSDDWAQRRRDVLARGRLDPAAVDTYLAKHCWDLFDPQRPWMQDPRLAVQAERKTSNVLDMTRPPDNSAIWWRHTHVDHAPPIPPHEALQWLVVHHYYGSGGTGGRRAVNSGDKTLSSQHMSSGPLRAAVVFYPLGRSLFETLLAGIPAPTHTSDGDAAPWEAELHDPLTAPPAPTWPAGILTGQSRHALLLTSSGNEVDGCYLTWGWKERHTPIRDPYCIHDIDPKDPEPKPRRADASRAAWRDLDGLLADRPTHTRPAVLADSLTLPDDVQDHIRVRAIGWHQDRQASNTAWYVSETPPLLRYMDEHDPDRAALAETLTTTADKVHMVLRKALRTAWQAADLGDPKHCSWLATADDLYWPAAERAFWRHLDSNTSPGREFVRAAVNAIDTATTPHATQLAIARETARAIRTVRGIK